MRVPFTCFISCILVKLRNHFTTSNNTKVDTPAKKTSTQTNYTTTLADIMKKLKLMDEFYNIKYKSIHDKLISYENKIIVS